MATNKTIPNALPPGAKQLAVVDDVIGQIETVARTAMDRQTANNRVGPGANKSKQNSLWRCSLHGVSALRGPGVLPL
jgi:hypothetical protein